MTTAHVVATGVLGLKVGDLVEVRSAEEIRATLDENGELDGLPFMPEMLAFCGRRLTVHKVAHKLCDNIGHDGHAAHVRRGPSDRVALRRVGARRLSERLLAVLEGAVAQARRPGRPGRAHAGRGRRMLLPLLVAEDPKEPFEDGETRWSCQATEMPRAAPERLPLKQLSQYREDVTSGNAGVARGPQGLPGRRVQPLPGPQQAVLPRFLRIRDGLHWGFLKGGVVSGVRRRSTWTSAWRARPDQVARGDHGDAGRATCSTAGWASTPRCPGSAGDRPGEGAGDAVRGRADRPDAHDEEPVHHPRGHRLRGRVHGQLPARVRVLVARDLAGAGRAGAGRERAQVDADRDRTPSP